MAKVKKDKAKDLKEPKLTKIEEVKKADKATVVEAKDKEVRVYGLITKTYNIGGIKVSVNKDKSFMLPIKLLPLLEGLKVVKKI